MNIKVGLLLACISLVCGQLPTGAKTTITQSGLNYAVQVGIEILEQTISTVTIPNQSGSIGTPIGNIAWQFTNIYCNGFQFPSASFQVNPGSGLTIGIGGAGVSCYLDWGYQQQSWPYISDSGTAQIVVGDLSLDVVITATETNGKPQVYVLGDACSIANLQINLQGGASWLYDIFIDIFSGEILDAFQQGIQTGIVQAVNQGLNQLIDTLPTTVPVTPNVQVSYALTAAPYFGNGYITNSENGAFEEVNNSSYCPDSICPVVPLPDTIGNNMLEVIVGEFVPDTASFIFWDLKYLEILITDSELPAWTPLRLNTSDWKDLLPELYELWPNHELMINLELSQPPELYFEDTDIIVNFVGDLALLVVENNQSIVPAFILQVNVNTSSTFGFRATNLTVQLVFIDCLFSIEESYIGRFDPAILTDYVNIFFSKGMVPLVNDILKPGVPLPTPLGIQFVNPTVVINSGYIAITTDFTYG